jgi:hypothetical protein
LRQLSIQHTGFDPDTNGPVQMLKLVERPDHSNFSECTSCGTLRKALEQALADKATRSRLLELHKKQLEHVQEMHAERDVVRRFRSEATDFSSVTAFLVDDKLGSHSQHLPMPPNERHRKDVATNYKYRESLMGTFYPGKGSFYFIVPPMLKTGGNFGCTSFIVSLCRLISNGRMTGVRRLIRQTDSGSDNVSWVTFALCATLVKEGVFDQVDWMRIMPGHSHNEADARHRQALGVFYPKKGTGPGCNSPLEFESSLNKGLRGIPGGYETLWQLASFDWAKWFGSSISSEFGNYKDKRWWRFVRDYRVKDHGGVRVLYKDVLTDKATASRDEWKPFDLVPGTELDPRYVTRPNGLRFMDRWPDTASDPGVEAFGKAADDTDDSGNNGWAQERVEKGVLDTARKLEFTESQTAEWRALFNFHKWHMTADSVPKTPVKLSVDDGRSHI